MTRNKQYNKIELKIQDAYLDLLDLPEIYKKINIYNLCNYANISRTTFYNHYKDIDHVLSAIETRLINLRLENQVINDISASTVDRLTEILKIIKDFKPFFKSYFSSIEPDITYEMWLKNDDKCYFHIYTPDIIKDTKYDKNEIFFYKCKGATALFLNWLNNNCLDDCKDISYKMDLILSCRSQYKNVEQDAQTTF